MLGSSETIEMPIKVKRKNPKFLHKLSKKYQGAAKIVVGYPRDTGAVGVQYPSNMSAEKLHAVSPDSYAKPSSSTVSVLEVAIKNNFGSLSENIPARPFMSASKEPAVDYVRRTLKPLMKELNKGTVENKKQIARKIAPAIAAIFKQTIVDWTEPPNSPTTIAAKGTDDPLVWTGLMMQTLTAVVR